MAIRQQVHDPDPELVVDAVIQPEDLRSELVKRFALYTTASREWPAKHNPVTPV